MKYIIDNQSDMPDNLAAWFAAKAYIDLMQPTEYTTKEEAEKVDGIVITADPQLGASENKKYGAYCKLLKSGTRKIIIYND